MSKNPEGAALNRIKEAMRDAGKEDTQEAIATLLGITQPSVAGWKKNGPGLKNAVALSSKLGVTVQWILVGDGAKRTRPDADRIGRQFWDLWPRLSEETKMKFLGHAQMSLPSDGAKKKAS